MNGGYKTWVTADQQIEMLIDIEADSLPLTQSANHLILDVHTLSEYEAGNIKHSVNLPLNELNGAIRRAAFKKDQIVYIYCGTGYRSVIAGSILKKEGIHNVRNIAGGWNKIKQVTSIELTAALVQ